MMFSRGLFGCGPWFRAAHGNDGDAVPQGLGDLLANVVVAPTGDRT
jgi:hypothetical protein